MVVAIGRDGTRLATVSPLPDCLDLSSLVLGTRNGPKGSLVAELRRSILSTGVSCGGGLLRRKVLTGSWDTERVGTKRSGEGEKGVPRDAALIGLLLAVQSTSSCSTGRTDNSGAGSSGNDKPSNSSKVEFSLDGVLASPQSDAGGVG